MSNCLRTSLSSMKSRCSKWHLRVSISSPFHQLQLSHSLAQPLCTDSTSLCLWDMLHLNTCPPRPGSELVIGPSAKRQAHRDASVNSGTLLSLLSKKPISINLTPSPSASCNVIIFSQYSDTFISGHLLIGGFKSVLSSNSVC